MLPECDFAILALPLTPETRGLIGEVELRTMKTTASIINIGRGPLIKQNILIKALKEGWIASAGLDVFESEPLPQDSELWKLSNVIITPHIAGYIEQQTTVLTDLLCENLRRYLAGEKLLNIFNTKRGY